MRSRSSREGVPPSELGFSWDTHQLPLRLAGESFRIECLRDLNQTIDALFDFLLARGTPELLELYGPYFGCIWPSARGLVEVLQETRLTAGVEAPRSVIEIGCGLALPSLWLARRVKWARLLASDSHPEVPKFLTKNLDLNELRGRVEYANWSWDSDDLPKGAPFDWVIGSDVLYEKQHPEAVARSLLRLCAPGGRVMLADPGRPYLQACVSAIEQELGPAEVQVRKDVLVMIWTRAKG